MFKKYFTNGVFSNPSDTFQVFQGTGMTINVRPGYGNIEGASAVEEEVRVLNIEASDANDRIDRVVLRLNDNIDTRKIDLYILKGKAQLKPVAPALERTDSIYELSLANIYISANSSVISQSKITDTRLDSKVCGIVAQAVNGIDTSTLYEQIKADLKDFKDIEQADFEKWFDDIENEYTSFIKKAIDTVERLSNKADAQQQRVDENTAKVNAITADLEHKRDTGAFIGPKGDNGVCVPTNGFYSFDVIGDDLWMGYPDTIDPPIAIIDADGILEIETKEVADYAEI